MLMIFISWFWCCRYYPGPTSVFNPMLEGYCIHISPHARLMLQLTMPPQKRNEPGCLENVVPWDSCRRDYSIIAHWGQRDGSCIQTLVHIDIVYELWPDRFHPSYWMHGRSSQNVFMWRKRCLLHHFALFKVDTDYATYRGRMVSTGTWDGVFGLWDCG